MGETQQGRFGPPPAAAAAVTLTWSPQRRWRLVAQVNRPGDYTGWERELELGELSVEDLVEAVATFAYGLR